MLRCIPNTDGVLDLTLSQIGLLLATGILLTVVFSFIFTNDWQRTAELQSLASSFSTLLDDIDNRFFDHTKRFQFPQKEYPYFVKISTEYIVLSAKGSWNSDLSVIQRFVTRPWIRYAKQNWTTGNDLHRYLNETYGHHGTENDSISTENFTRLCHDLNTTLPLCASDPLEVLIREPVWVEKVTIFYDYTKKRDFLLVYQLG
jgi:hypothetical protein